MIRINMLYTLLILALPNSLSRGEEIYFLFFGEKGRILE